MKKKLKAGDVCVTRDGEIVEVASEYKFMMFQLCADGFMKRYPQHLAFSNYNVKHLTKIGTL